MSTGSILFNSYANSMSVVQLLSPIFKDGTEAQGASTEQDRPNTPAPRGGGEQVYREHQHQAEGKGHPQDRLPLAWGVKKESDHF